MLNAILWVMKIVVLGVLIVTINATNGLINSMENDVTYTQEDYEELFINATIASVLETIIVIVILL